MKLLYRLLGMVLGVVSGAVGGAVFKRIWKWSTGEDEAPSATARDRGWREVLIAAAVEGAIFGAVKAAVDRASATAYQEATGEWPDD